MKRDHVSFDVFDTCLIRRCGAPHKIWDLMADRLFEKNDLRGKLSFTGNRQVAEKYASIEQPYPNLENIYNELDVSQWGLNKDFVMTLEMETEDSQLFPNVKMLKKVKKFRTEGFSVAFISDMYLPSDFIKKVLKKHGFCEESDPVFVSAECKAGKFNGKLFDFVLKETRTKAGQWLHYGDNLTSDVYLPKAKGIESHYVDDCLFSNEEIRWCDESKFHTNKHDIELWAGLCRYTRTQLPFTPENKLAVDFISSIYVPYVIYVLRTAKKLGLERLYFLGRDGRIFLEIAKKLTPENSGIDLRYLKVSRRVLYRCVLSDFSEFEFSICITKNKTVKQNLEYLGVSYDELSQMTREKINQNTLLNSDAKIEYLCKLLRSNDQNVISSKSKEFRQLFLDYLSQENFFEKKKALVDLGWVGTSRCAFNHILKESGFSSVPMFYWGVNQELRFGKQDDELFIFNQNIDFGKEFSCSNLFLEQYASMNEDGSCTGYRRDGDRIVVLEKETNESVGNIVDVNRRAVGAFVENLNDFGSFRLGKASLYDIFLCCGVKQMQNILRNPEKDSARILGKIKVEDYGTLTQLNSVLSIKDIVALLIWGIPVSFCWSELSIRKTFGPFAPVFKGLYKRTSRSIFAQWFIVWWERYKNKKYL